MAISFERLSKQLNFDPNKVFSDPDRITEMAKLLARIEYRPDPTDIAPYKSGNIPPQHGRIDTYYNDRVNTYRQMMNNVRKILTGEIESGFIGFDLTKTVLTTNPSTTIRLSKTYKIHSRQRHHRPKYEVTAPEPVTADTLQNSTPSSRTAVFVHQIPGSNRTISEKDLRIIDFNTLREKHLPDVFGDDELELAICAANTGATLPVAHSAWVIFQTLQSQRFQLRP